MVGQVDRAVFIDAEQLRARDLAGGFRATDIHPDGFFEIELLVGHRYVLTLEPGAVVFDGNVVVEPGPGAMEMNPVGDGQCEPMSTERCEFTTYNLEVVVGDRFRLSNFVDCDARLGSDYTYAYEGSETWNLGAFNADDLIEITAADLDGGNHGDGRYRFNMLDTSGEEIDHMTIRVYEAGEKDSDIRATDVDSALPEHLCDPADGGGGGRACDPSSPDCF